VSHKGSDSKGKPENSLKGETVDSLGTHYLQTNYPLTNYRQTSEQQNTKPRSNSRKKEACKEDENNMLLQLQEHKNKTDFRYI
jgi:hypothetical protein